MIQLIDPRTIKVYGNGGATLPQVADFIRMTTWWRMRCWRRGAGDGSFDANDYVAFYTPDSDVGKTATP
ncbi:MAG: hypothetical protein IPP17_01870 [Bacteroidetes bacterium]|nr:hypothetical protein [Bacteroidota bacterium]